MVSPELACVSPWFSYVLLCNVWCLLLAQAADRKGNESSSS